MVEEKKIGSIKIKGKEIIIGDPSISLSGKGNESLVRQVVENGTYNVYITETDIDTQVKIAKKKDIPLEGTFGFEIDIVSDIIGIFDGKDYRDNSIVPSKKKKWDKWQQEAFEGDVIVNKEKNSVLINVNNFVSISCEVGTDIDGNFAAIILYLSKQTIEEEKSDKDEEKGTEKIELELTGEHIGAIKIEGIPIIGDIGDGEDKSEIISVPNTSGYLNIYYEDVEESGEEAIKIILHRNIKNQEIKNMTENIIPIDDNSTFGVFSGKQLYEETDVPKGFKTKEKKDRKWAEYMKSLLSNTEDRYIIDRQRNLLVYVEDLGIENVTVNTYYNTENEVTDIFLIFQITSINNSSPTQDDEEQSDKEERKQKRKEKFAEEQSEQEEYDIEGISDEEGNEQRNIFLYIYGDIYLIPEEKYEILDLKKIKKEKEYQKIKKKLSEYIVEENGEYDKNIRVIVKK